MDKPFHNPFGALRGLVPEPSASSPEPRVSIPPEAGSPKPEAVTGSPKPEAVKGPARAVVRMERSGRGGKEVTVISHLGLSAAALETWMKQLKGALGCGGHVEGDELTLQGDQRKRLPALLTARGVKKITVA
jgi:translation initiation factor 1